MNIKMLNDTDLPKFALGRRNTIKQKEELQGNRNVLLRNYEVKPTDGLADIAVEMTNNVLNLSKDYVTISSIVIPDNMQSKLLNCISSHGLQLNTPDISSDGPVVLYLLLICGTEVFQYNFRIAKETTYETAVAVTVLTAIKKVTDFLLKWDYLMESAPTTTTTVNTLTNFVQEFTCLLNHLLQGRTNDASGIYLFKLAHDNGIINYLTYDALCSVVSCVDLHSGEVQLSMLKPLQVVKACLIKLRDALEHWVEYVKNNDVGDYRISTELAKVSYQLKHSDEVVGSKTPSQVFLSKVTLLSEKLVNILYENSSPSSINNLEDKVTYLSNAHLLPIGTVERLRDLLFFQNSRECRHIDLSHFVGLLHDQVKEVLMNKIATESEVVKPLEEYKTELENLLKEIKKHYKVAVCNLDDNESLSFVKNITDSGYGTLYINTVY